MDFVESDMSSLQAEPAIGPVAAFSQALMEALYAMTSTLQQGRNFGVAPGSPGCGLEIPALPGAVLACPSEAREHGSIHRPSHKQ